MTCRDFQKNLVPFINNKIDVKDLGPYIEHANSCNECRDEMEIYYVVQYGLNEHEEADGTSMNFKVSINNMLNKYHRNVTIYERARSFCVLVWILAMTSIGGSFIYVLFNYFLTNV